MPMSHKVMKQKIKKRLKGKTGKAKLDELHHILADLPNYRSGPYGQIRKSIHAEIQQTQKRSKIQHREDLTVQKEGDFQMAVVGAPNTGKSALLKALSGVQIKVAHYAFTTLRPIPARVDCDGMWIQLVEIPGIIEGAADNRGSGRALLSVAKNADGLIVAYDLTADFHELDTVLETLRQAKLSEPLLIVGTKLDCPNAEACLEAMHDRFPQFQIVGVSAEKQMGLDALKTAMREATRLIRIYTDPKGTGVSTGKPMVMPAESTVEDLAQMIHKDWVQHFRTAKIWGQSAKFPGQQVGKAHVLADRDIVTLYTDSV